MMDKKDLKVYQCSKCGEQFNEYEVILAKAYLCPMCKVEVSPVQKGAEVVTK